MLSDLTDCKKLISKKLQSKVDPGTFSFLEPGWWALHAASITTVYVLATMMARKSDDSM